MNAPILTGHAAIEARARELDASFLRRVRSASLHELRLIKRAHLLVGCDLVFGSEDFGCWRCEAIRRATR